MIRRDQHGLQVTSGAPLSLERYEQALTLFHGYYGNPLAAIDQALADDPEFLMGHALRAGLLLTSSEKRAVPELRASVEHAEALIARGAGTPRERAHIAAARAWLDGEFDAAADRYNRIALEEPRDMLAQQVAHLCNFFLGRQAWLRDTPAAALPHHDPSEASHGYLQGMLAFGLEEGGEYARAEEAGRRALAANRRDPWAVHAVAHCFEMQGQSAAGMVWLESRQGDWAPDNLIAVHNFWHLSLFYLDQGERERVLDVYDRRIRGTGSEVSLDLVDASALLWRLSLLGMDVRGRFEALSDVYRRVEEEGYYAFNDLHALMAYAGAGRTEDTQRVLDGLIRAGAGGGSNAAMSREVGLPACQAFAAFTQGDHARAVDILFPLRLIAQRFGGSHAQRDVLELTLIAAAQRAHQLPLVSALDEARRLRRQATVAPRMLGRALPGTFQDTRPGE